MSPSWLEQVRIGLIADRLIAARLVRVPSRPWSWQVKAFAHHTIDTPPSSVHATEHLRTLPALLGQLNVANRANLHVVLAHRFVRYLTLPRSDALKNHDDWIAFARNRFSATHGPAANQWDIRVCNGLSRHTRIACAIDPGLHAAWQDGIAIDGHRLISFQPSIGLALSRLTITPQEAPVWVVLHEPGRVLLGLVEDGEMSVLRSRQLTNDAVLDALPEMLARESALLGIKQDVTHVYVDAPLLPTIPPRVGSYEVMNPGDSSFNESERAAGLPILLN